MHIDFQDQTGHMTSETKTLLEKLVYYAAKSENIPQNAELSISFVDNEAIKKLNRTYRHIDAVTDVLSFGIHDDNWEQIYHKSDVPITLGDIIISTDRAQEQADEYNHSFMRELGFLTVHGFLHLIGYDHIDKGDEQIMFAKQKDILDGFGLER